MVVCLLQVVSNPFLLMASTDRTTKGSPSTFNQQPSPLSQALSHPPEQVKELDSHSLGPSVGADTEALTTRLANGPPSPSLTEQETSNHTTATNTPDPSSADAQQLLQQRTQLISTVQNLQNPVPQPDLQKNESQPAQHEPSAKRNIQAHQSLASSCPGSMAKPTRLKSSSNCLAPPPVGMMEMVRPYRQHSMEARGLRQSGSQSSIAFRTSSLPIDESSGVPQKLLDVEVYSLGVFAFKGLAAHRQIAQLMPTTLTERLSLFPHVLKRGKAICVTPDNSLLAVATAVLPDVSGLTLAR